MQLSPSVLIDQLDPDSVHIAAGKADNGLCSVIALMQLMVEG